MATSAIQQSAFTGKSKTGLRQGNEFIRKAGNFGSSRFTMRRTVKSAPESIW
jgi:light-harvesting complex II chlorophyll a/b binding protein 2